MAICLLAVKAAVAGALLGGAALTAAAHAVAQPVPPVPNADFNNTGQFDFVRDLMTMGNSAEFFQSVGPGVMGPTAWLPPAPYGPPAAPPPPAPGSPPVPASAPPPIWPPMPIPAPVP